MFYTDYLNKRTQLICNKQYFLDRGIMINSNFAPFTNKDDTYEIQFRNTCLAIARHFNRQGTQEKEQPAAQKAAFSDLNFCHYRCCGN